MKKTVYKKGDALRSRSEVPFSPAAARPRRPVSAAAAPPRRMISTSKACTPPRAVPSARKFHHKKPSAAPVAVGVLLLAAVAFAGAACLYSVLKPEPEPAIPADADIIEPSLQPEPEATPSPQPEPTAAPTPEPTPEPTPDPTRAGQIAAAQNFDQSAYPALTAALAGSGNAAFLALDLSTGQTLAWQPDTSLYIASAIKAPYALYVCQLLDAGSVAADELITFTENFFDDGSGTIKASEPGTAYRLDYLLQESLLHSDNIAYRLLVNRCGKDGFNALMDSLGITAGLHFTPTNIWPKATPREMVTVWGAILDYIQSDAPHSALLKQYLTSYVYSPIRKTLGNTYPIASKYGWDDTSYTDAGIVYSTDGAPLYLLAILTENGNLENGDSLAVTANIIKQIHAAMTAS